MSIKTTFDFWDCGCEHNFIHLRNVPECRVCGARREDQFFSTLEMRNPDSHVREVIALKRKMRMALAALANDHDRLNFDERSAVRWALSRMGLSVCIQCGKLIVGDRTFCNIDCETDSKFTTEGR